MASIALRIYETLVLPQHALFMFKSDSNDAFETKPRPLFLGLKQHQESNSPDSDELRKHYWNMLEALMIAEVPVTVLLTDHGPGYLAKVIAI